MTTSGEGGEGRAGEYPLTGVSVAVGEVEVLSRYLRGEGLACALLVAVVLYRLHSNARSRITLKALKERRGQAWAALAELAPSAASWTAMTAQTMLPALALLTATLQHQGAAAAAAARISVKNICRGPSFVAGRAHSSVLKRLLLRADAYAPRTHALRRAPHT